MSEYGYSADLARAINDFLVSDSWNFQFNEDAGTFDFTLVIKSRLKRVSYLIVIGDSGYTVYVTSPLGGDAQDRHEMLELAEFFCRANYGLRWGNFELDFKDGEIRYKLYVPCLNAMPDDETLHASIYTPAAMYDRYGQGIISIILNGTSGAQAVEACENPTHFLSESKTDMKSIPPELMEEMILSIAKTLNVDPDEIKDAFLEEDESDKTYDA